MFKCDCCHVEKSITEKSRQRPKCCVSCHKLINGHRSRMSSVNIRQDSVLFIREAEKLFILNQRRGGYVPSWFKEPLKVRTCDVCKELFYSKLVCATCVYCQQKQETKRTCI